jgi:hypothetical protein
MAFFRNAAIFRSRGMFASHELSLPLFNSARSIIPRQNPAILRQGQPVLVHPALLPTAVQQDRRRPNPFKRRPLVIVQRRQNCIPISQTKQIPRNPFLRTVPEPNSWKLAEVVQPSLDSGCA